MNDTPAFPINNMHTGMTLRDYFAAKALQSLITEKSIIGTSKDHNEYLENISLFSYGIADAMMEARKK